MRKQKVNLTLTSEARMILRNLASANGLSMSVVLEMLLRNNQNAKLTRGLK